MSALNGFHGSTRAGLALVLPTSATRLTPAPLPVPPPIAEPVPTPERFTDPKPLAPTDVLSPSSVNQFVYDCQAKWFYKRVLGLPDKRTTALALGSALHTAVEANFAQKIDTRADLPAAEVVGVFMEAFTAELDNGVELEKTESVADLRECGEVMAKVYMQECAPSIQPAALEVHVSGLIGDVPVQGFIDLLDVDGDIIDLKTAKKKPSEVSPGYRLQVSTYTMIEPRANGRARLDTLTKTKTVGLHQQTLEIGAADRKHTERLYSIAREQMTSGLFIPNQGSYMCSRKHCAYAERCMSDYGGIVE